MTITFGVIRISEEGREQLSTLFTAISGLQTVLSSVLIIDSIYVNCYVAPYLHSEKAVIKLIFTVIAMLSTQLAIYYMSGIFICRKCHINAYKKNSRYLLRIWTFSGYSSIINVVIIGTMAVGVSNHIIRSMHHSLVRGMKRYLKDIHWKKVIDNLQIKLKCCGSKRYTDWHEISWISTWHIITANKDLRQYYRMNGDHLYVPAVPWSCCKIDYVSQCFHDPLQQIEYAPEWKKIHEKSIYDNGCVEMLRQPIENSFLCFILVTYIIFIFQIILTIISRYLYTSYKNAVVLGDPFGTSPGWIITGKTASEIMAAKRLSLTTVDNPCTYPQPIESEPGLTTECVCQEEYPNDVIEEKDTTESR